MARTVILYGMALAAGALLLEWLEYKFVSRVFAAEFYLFFLAAGFTALGVWIGHRLTGERTKSPFQKNVAALSSLGITSREYETLELMAEGLANKEIARKLGVSPNTVKTHTARLYEKLDVQRRTQAVVKAKELALIP